MLEEKIKKIILAGGLAAALAGCVDNSDSSTDPYDTGTDTGSDTSTSIDEEPYGCNGTGDFQLQDDGSYAGTINMRYYETPTGIKIKNGQNLEVKIDGTGCWYSEACTGPDGQPQFTWGVFGYFKKVGDTMPVNLTKIGSDFNSVIALPDDGEYELYFIIPDGTDNTFCDEYLYQDNSGYFDVLRVYVSDAPPQDAGVDGGDDSGI